MKKQVLSFFMIKTRIFFDGSKGFVLFSSGSRTKVLFQPLCVQNLIRRKTV